MIRARFGIKLGFPFPNAATFVRNIKESEFHDIAVKFDSLKSVMAFTGFRDIAEKMFFEDSKKK